MEFYQVVEKDRHEKQFIHMFKAILSDITKLKVDAIVNAANTTLRGGGGVDGAIHRVAGPDLLAECIRLGGCRVGEAKITKAYRLPSRYVIHTVGPIWCGGINGEAELLERCYASSMALALKHACKSIAFPGISTGVFGYPSNEAAGIAVTACREFVTSRKYDCSIVFCCFYQDDLDIYNSILKI